MWRQPGWPTSGVNPRRLAKYVTKPDRYDLADYERLLDEVSSLPAASNKLTRFIDTGEPMMADMLWSLLRYETTLDDPEGVRPSHLINWLVIRQALGLSVFEELHEFTCGDDVAAAHACLAIEPALETLVDRLRTLIDRAKQLEKLMVAYRAALTRLDKLDPDDDALEQAELDALALGRQVEKVADELGDELEAAGAVCDVSLREAFTVAAEEAREFAETARLWGVDRTQLVRMPADDRLALARRLKSSRLAAIAELIGKLRRLTLAEQSRHIEGVPHEVIGVTFGRDLRRVLPSEIVKLRHPVARKDFLLRYTEGRLLQRRVRGTERVARGGIEYCEDGSGSMRMPRKKEYWARAVGLNLLDLAGDQGREFRATYFGSAGHYTEFDFTKPGDRTIEHVLEYAEASYGEWEGTDFETPLKVSVGHLEEEHARTGAVSADILFASDGLCGVSKKFMTWLHACRAELQFRVFGIYIGENLGDDNPYWQQFCEICDAGVWTIEDLASGEDIRDILYAL